MIKRENAVKIILDKTGIQERLFNIIQNSSNSADYSNFSGNYCDATDDILYPPAKKLNTFLTRFEGSTSVKKFGSINQKLYCER